MSIRTENRKARATTLAVAGAAVAVAATATGAGAAHASGGGVWDRVAQCESGGNWSINTGNGFYGGLQFTMSTWRAFGGSGSPVNASKSEQIRVAQRVLASQGPGAWPVCSVRAGLTGGNGGYAPQGGDTTAPKQAAPERASRSAVRQAAPKQQSKHVQAAPKQQSKHVQAAPKQQSKHVQAAPKQQSTPVQVAPKHAARQAAPAVPSVKASDQTITVKSGDSLSKLAESHDISSWRQLWAANSKAVSNPNLIFVGQVLHLPA